MECVIVGSAKDSNRPTEKYKSMAASSQPQVLGSMNETAAESQSSNKNILMRI